MADIADPICTICAVRLYDWLPEYTPEEQDPLHWHPHSWRESVLALDGPTWSYDEPGPKSMAVPSDQVTIYAARATLRSREVSLIPIGRSVSLQLENLPGQHESHDPVSGKRWYLGIHSACEKIARRVMQSPQAHIRTIGDLWMTLERRCVKSAWDATIFPPYLPKLPDSRPGEQIKLGLLRYYIPRCAIYTDEGCLDDPGEDWWDYDPLSIPRLTTVLLSNLEQLNPSTTSSGQIEHHIDSLPPEIKDRIITDLVHQNLSLNCEYSMPQYLWKQALLRVPFLWDIDGEVIEEKIQEAKQGGFEWNWEKITRQLLTEVTVVDEEDEDEPVTWNYARVGLIVPPGMCNRRRIWQILIEMYPNDVDMVHDMDETYGSDSRVLVGYGA
ncbi:hypothetical protein CEP54_010892 [Fusarium duplospermum]|uniref:Uncharacterized protein n=1 Tax=Fusarium duplospermum TaxID=1325734 RepID=A0A428PHJ4_9HYPO|nr:hypothetical protein CEP54_010892 [Fusarium duplospermum]